MKAKEFSNFIKALAEFLENAGAENIAKALHETMPLFEKQPDATMAQLAKNFSKITPNTNVHGTEVRVIISQMPYLLSLLKVQKSKALISDTEKFRDALKPYSSKAISEVIRSVIELIDQVEQKKQQARHAKEEKEKLEAELVYSYVSKLEDALGDENRFPEILKEMETKKPKLSVGIIKKIALQFSKRAAREIQNKKDAITAIQRRHEALMIGRAKSEATGNRTAA